MDKVKDLLAVACLAYERGDVEFAIKSFMSSMEEATSCGDLKQVVEFIRPPVAPRNADVPAAENTMSPALHSDNVTAEPTAEPVAGTPLPLAAEPAEQPVANEVKSPVVETPVDPQPVVAPVPEPIPSTITSLSGAMVDDGDEELEARAEAEDDIDDDESLDDEEDEDDDDSDEEEEDGMQLIDFVLNTAAS